jgi:hypothetical protein
MMHSRRRFSVSQVSTAEELAHMLSERTWTLCSGFYVAGHEEYLFLNDATHEDGAGEYGVIKGKVGPEPVVQLESITFSWCTPAKALGYIRMALAGQMDGTDLRRTMTLRLETPAQHRRCRLCE